MKHRRLAMTWDKWRERFQDIQLQPVVRSVTAQTCALCSYRSHLYRQMISLSRDKGTSCSLHLVYGTRKRG
jgi:hypothetical protein